MDKSRQTIGLLLVGHGSARHPDSAGPILQLAQDLRGHGPWQDQTAACFMKQAPLIGQGLDLLPCSILVVIPVFAGQGHYTDSLIPRAMGLDGPVTHRNGRTILYLPPAGCDPRIPGLMACRADGVARACGWDPGETGLLLIAHGSARPGGAGKTPMAIHAAIAAQNHFAQTRLVFLEQSPFAADWADQITSPRLVALPLLVAQGLHASQDIPPLFGLHAGQSGPAQAQGRQVALAGNLGAEPELVDIITQMALSALRSEPGLDQ